MTGPDPTGGDGPADAAEAFGPIDAGALRDVRELVRRQEPLVERATLDDPLNPQTLRIELADGIADAAHTRLDVRWSLQGNYSFHYTDAADWDFRFDCHPKPDAPRRHFHPPPDAPTRPVEASCIEVREVPLVTRAVLDRWRYAYEGGSTEGINDAENAP